MLSQDKVFELLKHELNAVIKDLPDGFGDASKTLSRGSNCVKSVNVMTSPYSFVEVCVEFIGESKARVSFKGFYVKQIHWPASQHDKNEIEIGVGEMERLVEWIHQQVDGMVRKCNAGDDPPTA